MPNYKFTVDTHLFRELGELLVGRDSTALIELIKNSYDADATEVTVHGQQLDRPEIGRIVVSDNGTGMTSDRFVIGFLRVASRLKDQGERYSDIFHRRYTGSKGIGRLAAHKLARKLEVDSVSRGSNISEIETLHAKIDWDSIEKRETLDEIEGTDAITLETRRARQTARSGTSLRLTKLRRAWTPTERARFFAEVQSFEAPVFLRQPLPKSVLNKALLFDFPIVREESSGTESNDGFRVNLEGDFEAGEEYWELAAEAANWVLEVRASQSKGDVLFGVAPTIRTRKENPDARSFMISIPHPDPVNGPFFDARILIREGRLEAKRDQRVWASRASGIRVYLEGFRVLPYGEPMDDWLSIDYDYTRRARQIELLREFKFETEGIDPDEGLTRLAHNNYFGALFLTQNRALSLRILVNREGFVPEAGFDTLVRLMRTGVDLSTRVRAAAAYASRLKRKRERSGKSEAETENVDSATIRKVRGSKDERSELPDSIEETAKLIHRARTHVIEGNVAGAQEAVSIAASRLEKLKDDVISERALLRVLASVGAQMAAFVHEINALLGSVQTVEQALSGLLNDKTLSPKQRRRLQMTLTATTELKRGLERHASYLMDVVTPDARRRRSRQSLFDRFQAAIRLVQHQAERRRIDIINEIPPELKSPPMFPAELTTVFANLLTNSVKAAGEDGKIQVEGFDGEEQILMRIQNTGVGVDLAEAERWFKPFESTTSEINSVLGQGMGLGLTITRNVLESYGSTIIFTQPDKGYATAIEISFPK